MKPEQIARMTDSEKLNYLVAKVERLDRKINPPLWKKILFWCQSHWVIVLTMVGMLYTLFHLWDEIQIILGLVEKISDGFSKVGQGIGNVRDYFK